MAATVAMDVEAGAEEPETVASVAMDVEAGAEGAETAASVGMDVEVGAEGPSPKSSERLVRHARARIPNDVRAREGDYSVGSRAPQTQGR